MKTFVGLLRGVNVAGKNRLPMAELRAALQAAGFEGARTYIQSGNVAFRSRRSARSLSKQMSELLESEFGLTPNVLVLGREELDAALDACPYEKEARADGRRVHLHFLGGPPRPAALARAAELGGGDRFELRGRVLYLHTPNGYGTSKLAEHLLDEKKLGVTVTARNHRTALALRALSAEVDG